MTIILDTDQFDPRDRAEMLATATQEASAPAYMAFTSEGSVVARYDSWQLGQLRVHRSAMTGFTLTRTVKQVRTSPTSLLAIQLQERNRSRLTYPDTQYEATAGQLLIMDLDLPYQIDWPGGQGVAMFVSREQLGLSIETIHAALRRPQHSPLYRFLANQIALTADSIDTLESDAGAPVLGDACVELVRAFLMSAATQGNEDGTALPQDILLTQIREYIRRQLSDPDLNAAAIARAHNISLRYLYKVCARAGLSLEKAIITQRLERVQSDLARPDLQYQTIAAIAYSHGFRDPSHFTRRFRAAYGMTPREWRREALERSSVTALPGIDEP
ncbi:helix-turn-helix domain-containing protein [Nocardia sp. CA-128927]|uniref:helix-turn-helix domain-containing protein n=1 Tax=Nocardia sp. CA-128927 TaxID=3239975 RepID=UPI003D980221